MLSMPRCNAGWPRLAGLHAQVPVVVAIDAYEYLHLPSAYGEWLTHTKRRPIMPEELRLAAALQLLSNPQPALGHTHIICADSGARSRRYGPVWHL